ncbi:MAG: hypothetical protein PUB97_06940, partial [Ruminococcus sp.]|nr:hypothetical protein [Ruminococcus sp.]
TCPCFLFSSRSDNIVPVMNTVKMIEALTEAGISYESHIYAYGIHGFSTNDPSVQSRETVICERVKNWVDDSISWLKDIFGEFGVNGMTKPECEAHVNGDYGEYLSINCTINCLLDSPQAVAMLESTMPETIMNSFQSEDEQSSYYGMMTLVDILGFANTPRNVIDQYNAQLNKIPNKHYIDKKMK